MTRTYLLLFGAALAACGGDDGGDEHEDVDAEGCEHLVEGPFTELIAGAVRDDTAPAIDDDHAAYRMSLPAVTGGFGGHVRFAASEAGDHTLFFDADVVVEITDAGGGAIEIEESADASEACEEVRGRRVVELAVGTSFLYLGSATEQEVTVVVEPGAHGH